MNKRFLIFLFFYIIYATQKSVIAENNYGNGAIGELGEKSGSISLFLVAIGFIYVALRRTHVLSKMYLTDEQKELKVMISSIYRTYRKPLLNLHYIVNILATIAAIIHGYLLLDADIRIVIPGAIATLSMFILSVSGIFIWKRFKPIWNYRSSRSAIRFLHRQWLFTGIFFVGLLLHFAFE